MPVLRILLALCHVQPGGAGLKEAQALIRALPPLSELDLTTFNTLMHYYKCMEDGQSRTPCFSVGGRSRSFDFLPPSLPAGTRLIVTLSGR